MQQHKQSQGTSGAAPSSQSWGSQQPQSEPPESDVLSAHMSTLPAATSYQQQQLQALQQHLQHHQLSQFQSSSSDPRSQALQQHLVAQQQQQLLPALGSISHVNAPSQPAPNLSLSQPQPAQFQSAPSTSSVPLHVQPPQLTHSTASHHAGQMSQSLPSQVARPVPQLPTQQSSQGPFSTAAQHAPTAHANLAVPQPAAPSQSPGAAPSTLHPHDVSLHAIEAVGPDSNQHYTLSQPASQAPGQPSAFRPPGAVHRPAIDAAPHPFGFRQPAAVHRPATDAAVHSSGFRSQSVSRPATEAASQDINYRPRVYRPATQAAQRPAYKPDATSEPAAEAIAAIQPEDARARAVSRPASEAAQPPEPNRPATLSRVASEAAEQSLETRPSGAPAIGRLVWAKLARYPWWPAEILMASDPYIPEGEEPPRLGAVPVRFFGTYAFAWIESKRAIEPYDQEHGSHAQESRQTEFLRGVGEANHYQVTGELPQGFALTQQQLFEEQQAAKTKAAAKAGKGGADDQQDNAKGKKGQKRIHDDPVAAEHARHRAVTARKLRLQRQLGLAPPAGSPFASATAPCLDGFAPVATHFGYVVKAAS